MDSQNVQDEALADVDPYRASSDHKDSENMDEDLDDYSDPSSDKDYADDDSSDEELLGKLALAYDPTQLSGSDLPQNGHDYLKLVQEERGKYPSVAIASLPQQTKESQQSQVSSPGDSFDTAKSITGSTGSGQIIKSTDESGSSSSKTPPNDLLYRDEMLNNFRNLRKKIEDIRDSITHSSDQVVAQSKVDLSCDVLLDNQKSKAEEEHQRQLEKSENSVKGLLKLINLGYPPQVSNLINKSQMDIHLALENLANLCEVAPSYSIIHADWIYSLMAALREPIEADIYSTLRRLAKICIIRRQAIEKKTRQFKSPGEKKSVVLKTSKACTGKQERNLASSVEAIEEEEYTSCLLIIGIVRYHFGQLDLSS